MSSYNYTVALTGSVSGSEEVMNLIMIGISPILLFLLEFFTYFAQRNAHFFFGTYFAQNSASKIYQCLLKSHFYPNSNLNGMERLSI